jgi:hypothetical protein
MLCIKTQNAGKLYFYWWAYNAFGRILNPEIIMHVDAGTKIDSQSIFKLWNAFYTDKNLSGACGQLRCRAESWKDYLNPIIAAQYFEYKVSFQPKRALESTTGYLSVLQELLVHSGTKFHQEPVRKRPLWLVWSTNSGCRLTGSRFRSSASRPIEIFWEGDPTHWHEVGGKASSTRY